MDSHTRLDSVDVLRGITIAGMIVVNDPGTWSAVYPQLLHAEWHGWTYTDTIFPFFLFVVGVSLALSYGRARAEGARAASLFRRTAVRALALVGIGLALSLVSFLAFHKEHMRYPGVLQRIGICVFVAGGIHLWGGARAAAAAAAALLLSYWGLMAAGPLEPQVNLAARLDAAVFGPHTWKPGWDPEGLLSTLPAIATTLLGVLAGERLRSPIPVSRKVAELLAGGAAAATLGLLWGRAFPINKNLWTSSYALLMAGLASIGLALCVWIVDLQGWKRWTAPFLWLGRNAIAAFALSSLTAIALIAIRVQGPDGKPRSLWTAIHRAAFDRFADPRLGSLAFALAYLALWVAVFGLLYRKRVFLKI
ncbi:MAG: heparan-alpha-glucosaminide N-acetyltransferase domain-containing protein [Thermoanaerobaculia bacterium]